MRQPVPFGKYLLLDRISVGGMAEVFKAKSYGVEGFEKIIAIKRILPTMGEDRDFIKMFIDEAKIAGQLAHANICQIFELGRIDGSHFIAMEYIWGKDLLQIQNRLRKIKQPMPVAMACFVIAKVLEGLDYAHRKRDPLGRPLEIVHRDCSPQNVLVSYEGEVKVIDFGIAKATSRNSRTMAGVLKGKFGYMSPEQVRGLPLDRRSDIFALGTMLYECLTSDRLFQGETDFSTLEKVRNVDIRPPREINPNIPEVVERVILKALARDVDDRYQWCSEMLADLQQYLMSQDVVFTAKSLSSWLKEVFLAEIERERALLEQYKRVGRDGLIANVPMAEAKLDVVEHLGEAPQPEGDATQLGGPNFDDLEQAVAAGANVELGPAPGSPAARGRAASAGDEDGDFGEEAPTEIFGEIDHGPKPTPAAPPAPDRARSGQPLDLTLGAPGPGRGPAPPSRSPTASVPPQSRKPATPPAAPPARPGTGRSSDPASPALAFRNPASPAAYQQPSTLAATPAPRPLPGVAPMAPVSPIGATTPAPAVGADGLYAVAPTPMANPPPVFVAQSYANPPDVPRASPANNYAYTPPPQMTNNGGTAPSTRPMPGVAEPLNAGGLAQPGQPQGRTMMGVPAPSLPNYAGYQPGHSPPQGYPPQQQYGDHNTPGPMPAMQAQQHPSMQQPAMLNQPPQQPSMQSMQQPAQPSPHLNINMHSNPSMPPYGNAGYNASSAGYGAPAYGMQQGYPTGGQPQQPYNQQGGYSTGPAVAVEQAVPVEGRKKSSIGRDIAIGVLIAALVLGGFLAVKFFILDSDDSSSGSGSSSGGTGDDGSADAPKKLTKAKLALPDGVKVTLYVDGKSLMSVATAASDITISVGSHKVKLVGTNGDTCEKEATFDADKVTTFECPLKPSAGSASTGSAEPAKGSAAGSAEPAKGSAAGSGSATTATTTTLHVTLGAGGTAKVLVDDKEVASLADTGEASVPTGAHKVRVVGGNGKSCDQDMTFTAGTTAKLECTTVVADTKVATTDKPKDDKKDDAAKKAEEAAKKAADDKRIADEKKAAEEKKKADEKKVDKKGGIDSAIDKALEKKDDKTKKPPDPVKPDDKGYVSVFTTSTPAHIFIDGVDTGLTTPINKLPLAPGTHKVMFVFKDAKYTLRVTVKAGETATVSKDL